MTTDHKQRIEALLTSLEEVVIDYLKATGGQAKRADLVTDLGLHQPAYPKHGPRAEVVKSWVAGTLLARLEQRGIIIQSKVGARTVVRFL